MRTLALVEECPNVPGRCAVGLGMQQLRQVGPTILNSFKGKEPVCVPRGATATRPSPSRVAPLRLGWRKERGLASGWASAGM